MTLPRDMEATRGGPASLARVKQQVLFQAYWFLVWTVWPVVVVGGGGRWRSTSFLHSLRCNSFMPLGNRATLIESQRCGQGKRTGVTGLEIWGRTSTPHTHTPFNTPSTPNYTHVAYTYTLHSCCSPVTTTVSLFRSATPPRWLPF